ncbi:RluA family pseudouridine synthase [Pelagibius sp.]|uniref:RluA family pseudouridine synthase n=1 Tax=Pelagibius sp. TaxID=1931238 RepID=UPI002635D601|nr:RluA family pseudouridine synthase [Pelagibius sp.]
MAEETGQERHVVTAAEAQAGRRLDRLLADALPALSRSRLKALIEAGLVSRDGAPVTSAAAKVRAGQSFAIIVPETVETALEAQAIPLDILFEDGDLIVLNKPAGLVVHPAPGNPDRTLVNALIAHCGESLTGIGGERRPGIVHRLDKDTSGLMVAAKTAAAHRGLVEQFAARSIERSYRGLVWGRPSPARGSLTGNIGRSPRNRKKMAVLKRGGRPAETGYRVLRSFREGSVSEVLCRLRTGRTHQIRVHMAEAGHSLLGDPLYGRGGPRRARALPAPAEAALTALGRQALHAKSLGFHHPVTGRVLQFDSNLPLDMCTLIDSLE